MADTQVTPVSFLDERGNISENFLTEHWIGMLPDTQADQVLWLYLGDGITNVTPKYTDKKKTAAYYDGGGNEQTTVTGVTASYDIQGDRSIGGAAQDYLSSLKFKTGRQRQLWFRKNQYMQNNDGSLTLAYSETGIVTFSDIDDGGGAADDNGSFKATATYISVPNQQKSLADLNAILLQTPCQNASILHEDLRQPQADGSIQTFSPIATADESDGDPMNSRPATEADIDEKITYPAIDALKKADNSNAGSGSTGE